MSTTVPSTRPADDRSSAPDAPVLSVRDLEVAYRTGKNQRVRALRGVSFDLYPETSLALVGESGCGKTTLGLALLRLLPTLGEITGGSIEFTGEDGQRRDVTAMTSSQLRRWRWSEAAMVFQGAQNAFNPVLTVGQQMADTLRDHATHRISRREIAERSGEALRSVRLEPSRVLSSYPHELSGGMKQRALIATGLLLNPRLLVLDEPTTALDILTQRTVIDLLAELREIHRFAMIFISHDLALAAELADRVITMYAGTVVETGSTRDIFSAPRHPYTSKLINAVPPVKGDLPELASIPGAPPSLATLPPGCPFAPRCELVTDACREAEPALIPLEQRERDMTHAAACIHHDQVHHERKVIARA
ncbi:ABC transporter ATP-binding protein [Brachybacterium sp. UMB0905]|uniref:ABC transporter ATP-binding protein n=1 Tax=Brachybacterium sp. UMB0905 TaxID=2069310 RepID=UPI000C806ABF|nr:ABC transporter ATP-binding protein [Brachybacterium sp. UMB0905]PMC74586.1 peptide ABC transporter ATP-binding protein [Brachybacterium sp. UMB0905]